MALFAVSSAIALHFYRIGAFAVYNVLFDTDPNTRIMVYAHGWPLAESSSGYLTASIHALLPYYFSPFIRVLQSVFSLFSDAVPPAKIREYLALLISPLCAVAQGALILKTCEWLGQKTKVLIFIAAIYASSFGTIIFASIPDHFSLGGLVVSALLAWLAFQFRSPNSGRWIGWSILAMLAAGTTITHLANAAFIRLVALLPRKSIANAAVLAMLGTALIGVIAIVVGLVLLQVRLHGLNAMSWFPRRPETGNFVAAYSELNLSLTFISYRLISFLTDSVQSIIPFGFKTVILRNSDLQYPIITLLAAEDLGLYQWAIVILFLFFVVFGIGRMVRLGGTIRLFSFTLGVLLLFNICLHVFFGELLFLYSQHWMPLAFVALAFAIEPLLNLPIGRTVAGLAVAGVMYSNGTRMVDLLPLVRATSDYAIEFSRKVDQPD